jgi:hypothetical protein
MHDVSRLEPDHLAGEAVHSVCSSQIVRSACLCTAVLYRKAPKKSKTAQMHGHQVYLDSARTRLKRAL